jgi:pheromone shutdown protein TraB
MLLLIGTGHVFDLSSALLKIFDERRPEVVCVELDQQRYNALMMKLSDADAYRAAGRDLPFVYRLLARFQDGMAQEYGVTAGDEMITAINYAQSHQLPVKFIDMNAQYLFTKMLRSMTFREKFKLMLTGFTGFFISKKRLEKELKEFENDFDAYIEEVGKKFPTVKRVLIDERNHYMVQQLADITEQYEKVVALMGDGHIPGVSALLSEKEIAFETIRLKELRSPIPSGGDDASTASFSMEYRPP